MSHAVQRAALKNQSTVQPACCASKGEKHGPSLVLLKSHRFDRCEAAEDNSHGRTPLELS
jgi:hypothetical protein